MSPLVDPVFQVPVVRSNLLSLGTVRLAPAEFFRGYQMPSAWEALHYRGRRFAWQA